MLKAYDLSVGVFVRGLTSLKGLLTKGEAFASATGMEPGALLSAELAADMYNLKTQVHWTGEGAKLAVNRLLGLASPPLADDAKTFAELHERIDAAIAHLLAVDADALEAGLARTIELSHRGGSKVFGGAEFLREFALPNFFFHLTTAYAILRHRGVPLQKGDFMGA